VRNDARGAVPPGLAISGRGHRTRAAGQMTALAMFGITTLCTK
jgi:hypothetical protein